MRIGAMKKQSHNKPNQTQFPKSPNECKLTYNKGLQKKRSFRSPKKQTQFKANFRNAKMNENLFATKDYENETAFRLQKYKPKQSQFQTGHLLVNRMKPKLLNFHLKIRKKPGKFQFSLKFPPNLLPQKPPFSHKITPPLSSLANK